jgi:beta-N-acetylhexosaminidase
MGRTATRRRLALGVLAVAAAGAFVLGLAFGKDRGSAAPDAAARLPPGQLAGERIVVGVKGTEVGPGLRSAIHGGRVAGVVLFAGNFPSRAAGARLVGLLQAIRRPPALHDPLLIMVDQEGGQVKRVGGAPTASAQEMGARGAAFSARQGRRTAANLRDLGVNVDLAPVLDVGRHDGVIAATERSFGATPQRVRAAAVPFARALQGGGVAATGKHFPGFGAAHENTDFAAERIDLSKRELRRVDEAAYPAFIAAGGKMVMLSTAIYPAFADTPAAFTRSLATGELRGRLGFESVSITDALETAAVRSFGGPKRAGLAAARAGTDLLLFAQLGPAEEARGALVQKLRAGKLDREAFEASAQRVLELRAELGR